MARRSRRQEPEEAKGNMTPMIDVTFLLLIFFICALKFKTTEGLIQSYLPKNRGQSGGTPSIDLNQVRIKLLFYKDDGTPIDPTSRADADPDISGYTMLKVKKQVLSGKLRPPKGGARPDWIHDPCWERLYDIIIEAKKNYKGKSEKGLPVIIDSRRQVPFMFVVRALDEVVKAEIKDVTFAAPEKPYVD